MDIDKIIKDNLELALTTRDEDIMFKLLTLHNNSIANNLAKNPNITSNVINELLDNYIRYAMCSNLAKNKQLTKEHIEILYEIANSTLKGSMLKEELDSIF